MLPRRLSACEPGVNYPPLTKKRNLPQMLNKVTLIGYTGKAVEQKYTPGGTAVARVSVATSKRVKKNDEWQSVTQWHECVLFGKPAESEYIITIAKGTQVFVEGELQHRKFQKTVGKEKVEWPVTEIVVSSLKKLGKAQKTEMSGALANGPEFSEEITDDDVPC
jgi:single-strand DNA-binding protein